MLSLHTFAYALTCTLSYAALLPLQTTNPHISTVSLVNSTLPRPCSLPSVISKLDSTLTFNPLGFAYHIPNTSRHVCMIVDVDTHLNATSYNEAISTIRARMLVHIDTHGDGPLWPGDNPTSYDLPHCYLQAESKRDPISGSALLTYGMMCEMMDVLQDYLEQRVGCLTVFWDLEDQDGTFLGMGRIIKVQSPGLGAG